MLISARIVLITGMLVAPSFNGQAQTDVKDLNVKVCQEHSEDTLMPLGRQKVTRTEFEVDYVFRGVSVKRKSRIYQPENLQEVPLVIFLPGGTVDGNRYNWLGETLASNRYAVSIVQENLGSTFDRMQWVQATIDALSQSKIAYNLDLTKVIIGGHSFGGVSVLCLNDKNACGFPVTVPDFPKEVIGSFILNSHIQPANNPGSLTEMQIPKPLMMIYGTKDGLVADSSVKTTFSRLRGDGPFFLAEIPGANHFQSTDCVIPGVDNLAKELPATITHEYAIQMLSDSLLAFLRYLLPKK